jgi:hypothetical protein
LEELCLEEEDTLPEITPRPKLEGSSSESSSESESSTSETDPKRPQSKKKKSDFYSKNPSRGEPSLAHKISVESRASQISDNNWTTIDATNPLEKATQTRPSKAGHTDAANYLTGVERRNETQDISVQTQMDIEIVADFSIAIQTSRGPDLIEEGVQTETSHGNPLQLDAQTLYKDVLHQPHDATSVTPVEHPGDAISSKNLHDPSASLQPTSPVVLVQGRESLDRHPTLTRVPSLTNPFFSSHNPSQPSFNPYLATISPHQRVQSVFSTPVQPPLSFAVEAQVHSAPQGPLVPSLPDVDIDSTFVAQPHLPRGQVQGQLQGQGSQPIFTPSGTMVALVREPESVGAWTIASSQRKDKQMSIDKVEDATFRGRPKRRWHNNRGLVAPSDFKG